MKLLRKDNGVTLTVLIITIIVLLILASTATYTGLSTIQSSKLTAFTTEMKIIQTEVNYLQSKIEIDEEGNKVINGKSIYEIGQVVDESSSEINTMKNNMSTVWNETVDLSAYRYYNTEDLKNDLNISEIKQVVPVLIDLETASIISVKGIKYEGKMYYKLEQLPDNIKNISQKELQTNKPTFEATSETTRDEMKIILSNIEIKSEYVAKYKIQYKAIENTDWTTVAENLTVDNYSFNVKAAGNYDIKIVDAKDQESDTIEVEVVKYVEPIKEAIYDFSYTGEAQKIIVPYSGYYQMECWGASGAAGYNSQTNRECGGKGAYTKGIAYLEENQELYVYVGQGKLNTDDSIGGWNGGGDSDGYDAMTAAGGGATDIRLIGGEWNNFEGLKSRIMVAAGGGGHEFGGAGGTLSGIDGGYHSAIGADYIGYGATQISGGQPGVDGGNVGLFGIGGNGIPVYDGHVGGRRPEVDIMEAPELGGMLEEAEALHIYQDMTDVMLFQKILQKKI